MKKQYIHPEMEIVEMEMGQQILADSVLELPFNPEGAEDVTEGLSRELDLLN